MEAEQFGEVIQADSQSLAAECHKLYHAPAFGSFIRVSCAGSGRNFFAVVTRVSTGAFDGARVIQAHRLPPGELEERKPHLPSLLRTQFEARFVGWGEDGVNIPGTPPSPPRLHCWIYPAEAAEIRAVTARPDFLRALAATQDVSIEDLLTYAMRAACDAAGSDAPLIGWGKYLARLLRGQYVTLESVLERLSLAASIPPLPAVKPAKTGPAGWEEPIAVASGAPRPAPARPAPVNGGGKYSSGLLNPFED